MTHQRYDIGVAVYEYNGVFFSYTEYVYKNRCSVDYVDK